MAPVARGEYPDVTVGRRQRTRNIHMHMCMHMCIISIECRSDELHPPMNTKVTLIDHHGV